MPTREQTLRAYQAVQNPVTRPHVHGWIRYRAAADAPMQAAARSRAAAPGERETADTDILSVLTRQHDQVTALMKQLKAIPGVAKGGSPVHQSRRASRHAGDPAAGDKSED